MKTLFVEVKIRNSQQLTFKLLRVVALKKIENFRPNRAMNDTQKFVHGSVYVVFLPGIACNAWFASV